MSAGLMMLLTGLVLIAHALYSTIKIAVSEQEEATMPQAALLRFNYVGGFFLIGAGSILLATVRI